MSKDYIIINGASGGYHGLSRPTTPEVAMQMQ